ncbi:hypothetical protein K2X40_04945 [Candidatus Babeliales bacterium]|nr:hypothetical protein [Candidatus Babeliales bacterium]
MTPHLTYALWGSTLFELMALAHRLALFALLEPKTYGYLVSILSIIHVGNHVADFGASNSIPALFNHFLSSKKNFRTMLFNVTLAPHLPLALATGFIVAFFAGSLFKSSATPQHQLMIMTLVVLETMQGFLRRFLYTAQKTKEVVCTELGLFLMRAGTVWFVYFALARQITVMTILYSHLLESIVMLACFIVLMRTLYAPLPEEDGSVPRAFDWSFVSTKFFNYLLRLSRNIFSTSFLTPLFAVSYGLECARIFHFAGKFAHSLLSVIKITVGYAGGGLLVKTQQDSAPQKASSFSQLNQTLLGVLVPALMLFVGNFYFMSGISTHINTCLLSLLFLLLSISEGFFILYENLFIINHATHKLFFLKISELGILYALVHFMHTSSPTFFLASIICLRMSTLALVAQHAYRTWIRHQRTPLVSFNMVKASLASVVLYASVYIVVLLKQ